MDDYKDIINMPHYVSKIHKPMSRSDRAAQFAPFAALTGYDAVILERARLTDARMELSQEEIESLNSKLLEIKSNIANRPCVLVTYFVPDEKKSGGKYVDYLGKIRVLDEYKRVLITCDRTEIAIDDIYDIELKPEV